VSDWGRGICEVACWVEKTDLLFWFLLRSLDFEPLPQVRSLSLLENGFLSQTGACNRAYHLLSREKEVLIFAEGSSKKRSFFAGPLVLASPRKQPINLLLRGIAVTTSASKCLHLSQAHNSWISCNLHTLKTLHWRHLYQRKLGPVYMELGDPRLACVAGGISPELAGEYCSK